MSAESQDGIKENHVRVTTILGMYTDFSTIPDAVLKHAASRGTEVHQICAAIALGMWIPAISAECKGYVDSFKRWFELVDEVLMVEERLYDHTFKFTGQVDLVVKLRGDKSPRVVDLKTPITKGRTWFAQIAAYNRLAEVDRGFLCKNSGTLRLSPAGRVAKFDNCNPPTEALAAFLGALTSYNYFKS